MPTTTTLPLPEIDTQSFDPPIQLASSSPEKSLFATDSPLVALLWFETIAACCTYGLGFVGNFLSLGIFCSLEEFRKVSTGLLFILITVSNTVHLWTLTTEFLGIFDVYIYANGFAQCQLNYFVQNVSRAVSTYLAVTIALDRLVRSEWPLRTRMICTRRNATKLAIAYLIISSVLWSFYFLPYVNNDPTTNTCSYDQSAAYYFFLSYIHAPVRAVLVCFIPVIIIVITNIRLLNNVRQSRRRVGLGIPMKHMSITVKSTAQNDLIRRKVAFDRMLFYMMLANVSTFIVTQIPFHIQQVVRGYDKSLNSFANKLVRAMLLIWSSLFFGIAIYLYCLASPLFREKFIIICKKLTRRATRCSPRT